MSYKYKVVPFIGRSRGSLSASDVAQQLESAIAEHASSGWELLQLADVNIEVQPGCLGGLFGAKIEYVRFDQLIFRSKSAVGSAEASTPEISAGTLQAVRAPVAHSDQPQGVDTGMHRADRYQPKRLYGGKIACWKCGAANDPRQIRCSQCESELYERP